MQIRRAGDDDVNLAAELRLAFLADHRGVDPAWFDPDFVAQNDAFVAERHHAGDLLMWFADDDVDDAGVPAGIVSMALRPVPPRPETPATTEGYLLNLYVVPPRRRQGIGQLLLDAALDHARSVALRRVVLHATEDGRAMYERARFVRSERWYELDL